jgi:arsenate reductase
LGLEVETFSGGTEITAFNPRAVAALRRAGLEVHADDPQSENPNYNIRHAATGPTQVCFSKKYDDAPNPSQEYCAIMTCSHADAACPIVHGCELRIPIRYDDPKAADDTPKEEATYDERSKQICREMLYMMSRVTA